MEDIRDDHAVIDAFERLGTMLEHRDDTIRHESQQGWDWFLSFGVPKSRRPLAAIPQDDWGRLAGLCLHEDEGYTWHLEDLYYLLAQRLPGGGGTPPDWWNW